MQISNNYGNYSSNMIKQVAAMNMIKASSNMAAQTVDKLMTSVLPSGVGEKINTYA